MEEIKLREELIRVRGLLDDQAQIKKKRITLLGIKLMECDIKNAEKALSGRVKNNDTLLDLLQNLQRHQ